MGSLHQSFESQVSGVTVVGYLTNYQRNTWLNNNPICRWMEFSNSHGWRSKLHPAALYFPVENFSLAFLEYGIPIKPYFFYLWRLNSKISMAQQTTSSIIMVRPAAFGFNAETAANNTFQHTPEESPEVVKAKAIEEFDRLVDLLKAEGVEVKVIQDIPVPVTPDAIFPNNWISFHEDGTIVTYPMFASLRRQERREEIIQDLEQDYGILQRLDFERYEEENIYLEGTGSMVLDRVNKIAYACLSPRTDPSVLDKWCRMMDFTPFTFIALYHLQEIYHTNVMMAIGDGVAVACIDVIEPISRGEELKEHLTAFGREVVLLRKEQIDSFAGNMLAIRNNRGEQLMVMSKAAHQSLDEDQVNMISRYARIISSDVETIETIGGGSVRCMIAENFLPQR